jgi:hypothetical protein
VFAFWFDPVWKVHGTGFHYAWGWEDHPWYRSHRNYWTCYPVYRSPSEWVTDWLIAGYVADRYDNSVNVDQALQEARRAREEAEQARIAAQQAGNAAELAQAQVARAAAEERAVQAEKRAALAEAEATRTKAQSDLGHANATPIDQNTKEALRAQIERSIAEEKQLAQSSAGGTPSLPDLSRVLADPNHIYPVSKAINVVAAENQSPAGILTEGDLIKLEPGQAAALRDANENTFVTMRVLSSKGDDGEVKAGTLISVPLKSLQEFDSEFRAKLDLGMAEAERNKEEFKKGA